VKRITVTGLAAAAAVVGACAPSNDPVYTQFFRPAGAIVNDGEFGAANEHNMLVQTGQSGYAYSLAQRFSSEVSPVVNFAFNSATLSPEAQATLTEQARWIRQFPEVRFRVYGHTDLVGSQAYNKQLGLRRAQAVVAYLTAHGISRSRLEAVVSFGETQPLIVTEGRERRNRRTVTEVSGFVQSHPLVLDGKYAQIVYRGYVESAKAESDLRTFNNSQLDNISQ
jgi:peptidoglycan-associated lipoprotein